jgi:hypothetical protein
MKARITFGIGVFVLLLGIVQFALSHNPMRLISVAVGNLFVFWGWKIGWATHRRLIVLLGHFAIAVGCLCATYGLCQIHFLSEMPTVAQVLDMPLFWGLFSVFGGMCMIKHGHCACCIAAHTERTGSR